MTKALRFLAALLVAVPVFAQAQRIYSQPELDQMLAPVALYPDPLLSQVMMAATYPAEVNEAAAWSRANPGLQGDEAVRAVQYLDWDPSVKSLVAFPQILVRMAENPQWTQALGEAFLEQAPHVMDTVQQLRRRAQTAGNLQSGEHLYVQQEGQSIVIQPASPQYVYVPYYDPMVVYGPWWWSAYQPVYWAPWPGYARHYRAGFWWGRPVGLSRNFLFGNFDWHHRHARVAHQRWQPDTRRREAFAARRTNQAQQIQVQPAARVQAQPAAAVQTLPTAQPRTERRAERRAERQAAPAAAAIVAPAQAQPQPVAQPRVERREERREVRQAAREQTPAAVVPQVRVPAANAPAQSRAERQEQRQERREERIRRAGERS